MRSRDDQLFEDPRPSQQTTRDLSVRLLREAAYRIAQRLPQAVIKVTSYGHDAKAVGATLSYISRTGEIDLEDPEGTALDAAAVTARLAEWAIDFDTRRKRSRESMHLVLSSPRGSDVASVRRAGRAFARAVFGSNHDYLFAVHADTDNPHVHLCVQMRGFDGKKLDPGRQDLRQWRSVYAEQLRAVGIAVEASPRLGRGLDYAMEHGPLHRVFARGELPEKYQRVKEKAGAAARAGREPTATAGAVAARQQVEAYRHVYQRLGHAMRLDVYRYPEPAPALSKQASALIKYAQDMPALESLGGRLYRTQRAQESGAEAVKDRSREAGVDRDPGYDLEL